MAAPALSPAYFQKKTTDELIAARDLVENILDYRARQFSLFDPPADNRSLSIVSRTTTPAAPPVSAIPEVLSPTTVSGFQDCAARWWYKKVLELPEQRTAALALGSAVHEALAVNFSQKIQTGEDIATEGIALVFRDSFAKQLEDAALGEDESADDLAGCGESMIRVYMREAAPTIQPAAVELPVEGEIGGVRVHGIVDLLTVDGDVIDIKTAARKPSGVSAAHRLQVSTYAMLTAGASGRGRVDTLTKGKTTALHTNTVHVGAADRRLTERLYSITLDQMRASIIAPRRESFLCSRKHCAYVDRCIADFGGEVE